MSKSKKLSASKGQETPLKGHRPHFPPLPKREGSNRDSSFLYRHLIAIGLIVTVALIVYSNTFSVPFLFDDRPNIVQNPNIQINVFSWDRIAAFVTNTYRESIRVFSYFTLALNYYFGQFNVLGYHVVNLFIHIVTGILVYGFLLLTFRLPSLREKYGAVSYRAALFAGLIFISHPVQTQSVTYIVQRMASLGAMFYLLAFVLYIKGRCARGKTRFFYFGGGALSYLLGIFSKENVIILPFFIALYEFYFFERLDVGAKGKKIIFALLGALVVLGACGLLIWGRRYYGVIIEGYKTRNFTLTERVLTQFRVVLYYLTLLAYPHPSRLILDYDFPISKTILDPPTTLISILIVFGLIVYSFWVARKRPLRSFFILWYFGNLLIESSIFPLEMVYEHRLYLPSVGPFALFSLGIVMGIERWKARGGVATTKERLFATPPSR